MDEDLNNPSTLIIYRRADGDLIDGVYPYVENLNYFDHYRRPIELVKELWVLGGRRKYTYTPRGYAPESD